jgi:hypothetical protein
VSRRLCGPLADILHVSRDVPASGESTSLTVEIVQSHEQLPALPGSVSLQRRGLQVSPSRSWQAMDGAKSNKPSISSSQVTVGRAWSRT